MWRLEEIMKLRGMAPDELAEVLWPESDKNSSRTLVKRLIEGEARLKIEWIGKICTVLNVTPNDLFSL
jgi:DNA-binding Xre family transcriptional regulator